METKITPLRQFWDSTLDRSSRQNRNDKGHRCVDFENKMCTRDSTLVGAQSCNQRIAGGVRARLCLDTGQVCRLITHSCACASTCARPLLPCFTVHVRDPHPVTLVFVHDYIFVLTHTRARVRVQAAACICQRDGSRVFADKRVCVRTRVITRCRGCTAAIERFRDCTIVLYVGSVLSWRAEATRVHSTVISLWYPILAIEVSLMPPRVWESCSGHFIAIDRIVLFFANFLKFSQTW